MFYSYRLTIQPYSISCSSQSVPSVTVPIHQITSITLLPDKRICIRSESAEIYVPAQIQHYERVWEKYALYQVVSW